jgi:hypothetical protein
MGSARMSPIVIESVSQTVRVVPEVDWTAMLFIAWCIVFLGLAYFKRLFARADVRLQY